MKPAVLFGCLIFGFLAISLAQSSGSIGLEVGNIQLYDSLIKMQKVQKKKIPLLPISVELEETIEAPPGYEITYIKAEDQKKNGHGAKVVIQRGGPGNPNVTLKFESQTGHSIDYVVYVYGKKVATVNPGGIYPALPTLH